MSQEIAGMLADAAMETIKFQNSSVCWLNLFINYIDWLMEKAKDKRDIYSAEIAGMMVEDALSFLARQGESGKLMGATEEDMGYVNKKLLEWKEALPDLSVWK